MSNEQNNQVKLRVLQDSMRDLLGFVRMENAVLMDQGHLSLRGLYLQKMIVLKDLEEQAELLAQEQSDDNVVACLTLLQHVQKELKLNTVHHIEALKTKPSESHSDDQLTHDFDLHEWSGGQA